MLEPKVKYRKLQKGAGAGPLIAARLWHSAITWLKAVGRGWMSAREIEAARVALTRYLKRGGKVWIRIFPDKPLTKKPLETRMGKGKGRLKCGLQLSNRDGFSSRWKESRAAVAKEAFRLAAHKLSIPTITVQRRARGPWKLKNCAN